MNISIKTIPHSEQRYDTVGDWWFEGEGLEIRVSDMGNPEYEYLVGRHEADEAILCKKRGINEQDITEFDKIFESHRLEGNTDEPGDHKDAPYRKEHFFATTAERALALELGIDWQDYENLINGL